MACLTCPHSWFILALDFLLICNPPAAWNDEPELKFAALERVVARFKRRNGRSPTFWLVSVQRSFSRPRGMMFKNSSLFCRLDKVCIDQSKIIDGLKVLPINIAACNKVLVLCGDTYPRRLWCVACVEQFDSSGLFALGCGYMQYRFVKSNEELRQLKVASYLTHRSFIVMCLGRRSGVYGSYSRFSHFRKRATRGQGLSSNRFERVPARKH